MFVGIDLGTGSVKVALIDEAGRLVRMTSRTYTNESPEMGYSEINPAVWWRETAIAVRECLAGAGDTVKGVGLSGQAHGFVLVDKAGEHLRNAILWPDLRTTSEVRELSQLPEKLLLALANPIATGMAGPGMMWLAANEAELFGKADRMLSPKDWLRFRMTGELATEASDASMTLLYDIGRDDWSTDLIERIDLRASLLPNIVESTAVAGQMTDAAATELKIPAGVPVAAGLADSAACLLGMGLQRPGSTVLQIGSGIQIMSVVDHAKPERQPFYNTYRGVGGVIYKMAAMQNGGTAFEWARKLIAADWDEMYRAAFEPNPGNGGIMFLPYVAGERAPILDPSAAASLTGLRLGTTRENMIRAIFEGVALAIRDSWSALAEVGVSADHILLAGGGSGDPRWRQLLADTIGVPLLPSAESANATRGAALLGGLAAGHWRHLDDLPAPEPAGSRIEPAADTDIARRLAAFRDAYRRLKA